MPRHDARPSSPLAPAALCLALLCLTAHGQGAKPAPQDDVVRVETEIVQTDVSVFDGEGRFVDGLTREQFEVRVDGKPVPVVFFERVAAGSPAEAAARAVRGGAGAAAGSSPLARARGRTVAFFVDDLHLSAESIERVRATVSRFVEQDMRASDSVVVASASGRVGFLQQVSDNKAVLRAALARVAYRPSTVRDHENIAMTEYLALKIDQGDRDALDHFVTQTLLASNFRLPAGGGIGPPAGGPVGRPLRGGMGTAGLNRQGAERLVKERAQRLVNESSHVSLGTLRALEGFLRSWSRTPGRKLVFFFSDGFFINDRSTDFADQLKQITDAALRAGTVIYSLDARGLVGTTDAASNRADPTGQLSRASIGELAASQDPLTALAADTGGRALLNSAAMDSAVDRALGETSNYYLLAWRPEGEGQKGGQFKRVEVGVKGRPELKVRLPRGYLAGGGARPAEKVVGKGVEKVNAAGDAAGAKKGGGDDLREALGAAASPDQLPLVVSTSFVDVPGTGPVLTSSVQVAAAGLGYGGDGQQPAAVDVAGVVLNDQGKQAAGFKTRLNVTPPAAAAAAADEVIYNHRAPLAPGLYQVRVAARDERTGQVGADTRWVEIPDLSKRQLTLSSLHLGGRPVGGGKGSETQVQFSVDHRFARASKIDFLAFVYNATHHAAAPPDLSAQVRILRDGRALVSGAPRKLQPAAGSDAARVPLTGALNLGQLPPGLYELEVVVNDHLAKTAATQRAGFEIR